MFTIKLRLNLGNVCYHSVKNVPCYSFPLKHKEIKQTRHTINV